MYSLLDVSTLSVKELITTDIISINICFWQYNTISSLDIPIALKIEQNIVNFSEITSTTSLGLTLNNCLWMHVKASKTFFKAHLKFIYP